MFCFFVFVADSFAFFFFVYMHIFLPLVFFPFSFYFFSFFSPSPSSFPLLLLSIFHSLPSYSLSTNLLLSSFFRSFSPSPIVLSFLFRFPCSSPLYCHVILLVWHKLVLRCYQYKVYWSFIIPPILFSETCRCYQRLTTNWFNYPPYVNYSISEGIAGIFPPLLKSAVSYCCQTCQQWNGESYIDFNLNARDNPAQQESENLLKQQIDNETDISFPVYGWKTQDLYKNQYPYTPFIESPGHVFIVISEETDSLVKALIISIFDTWPVVLLTFVFATLSGVIIWLIVCLLSLLFHWI